MQTLIKGLAGMNGVSSTGSGLLGAAALRCPHMDAEEYRLVGGGFPIGTRGFG
jgi:hypothetical protein